jgi:hypothetical protein
MKNVRDRIKESTRNIMTSKLQVGVMNGITVDVKAIMIINIWGVVRNVVNNNNIRQQ